VAPLGAYWDWLVGHQLHWKPPPVWSFAIWNPAEYAWLGPAPALWWLGLWGLGLAGAVLALRAFRGASAGARGALLFGPLALVGLLLAYLLRHDLWAQLPDVEQFPSLNARYLIPLVPTLFLCIAGGLGRLGAARGPAIWAAWSLLALMVVYGGVQRLSQWQRLRTEVFGLRIYQPDGWADRSVPGGEPRQRLRRMQYRPTDLEAALGFLEGHEDSYPECRLDHVLETGRRLGLALKHGGQLDPWLARLQPQVDDHAELRHLAEGMSWGLVGARAEGLPEAPQRMAQPSWTLPGLEDALWQALGRRSWELFPVAEDGTHGEAPDARLWEGVCQARGAFWVQGLRGEIGERPKPQPIAGIAGECQREGAFWQGAGGAWAHYAGCGMQELEGLLALEGVVQAPACRGLQEACVLLRRVEVPCP